MKWFFTLIIAAFAVISAYGLDASVVIHFKNGDRISGSLVEESADSLVVKTMTIGSIQVKRSDLKELEIERSTKQVTARSLTKSTPKKEETPQKEEAVEKSEPATERLLQRAFSFFDFDQWKQRLEFGMNSQSGRRDKNDFSLRYDMRKKLGKNDHRIETRVLYGETNDVKSTDKLLGNYRWRRDIAPGVFYESLSAYSFDAIKEIDHNIEQKLGIGYRWVDEEDFKFSTGGGFSGRYRDDATENSGLFYLVDLFQDIDYRLNKRLRMTQEFRFAIPPSDADLYEYDFRAAMISDITDSLNFTIRYQLEYDNSQPEDRREDQRLISAIGMDF